MSKRIKKKKTARRTEPVHCQFDGRSVDGTVWATTDMYAGVPCGSTIVHGEIPLEVAYITNDSPKPYLSAIFGDGTPTVITRAKLVDIAANLMLYSTLVNNLLASLPRVDTRK